MPQILILAKDKHLVVDRSWRDNGRDAEWAFVGGQKVKIADQVRPRPEIFQRGNEFFYKDGSPVTNPDDVAYLPEPFRSLALKFIASRAETARPQKVYSTKEAAAKTLLKTSRGRGRPRKTEPVLEIKDPESYKAAGGVEV